MHKVCRTMAAMLLRFIYDMSPAEAKCPCSVGELLEAEAEVEGRGKADRPPLTSLSPPLRRHHRPSVCSWTPEKKGRLER